MSLRHLSKPKECTRARVNPRVNYGLWVIMTCQYWFMSCNKCTILLADIDNGEGYASVQAGRYVKSLYSPLNLAVNLKLL